MSAENILIIDDDSRNIFALSAVLKAKGYPTTAAAGMKEAFTLLEKDPGTDIILMDMMMPEMDGYEAIRVLKSSNDHRAIPVIAVTAQAMPGDREKCMEAGADGYLSKPVDIDKLLELIKQFAH